jgi:hypothetical protein
MINKYQNIILFFLFIVGFFIIEFITDNDYLKINYYKNNHIRGRITDIYECQNKNNICKNIQITNLRNNELELYNLVQNYICIYNNTFDNYENNINKIVYFDIENECNEIRFNIIIVKNLFYNFLMILFVFIICMMIYVIIELILYKFNKKLYLKIYYKEYIDINKLDGVNI